MLNLEYFFNLINGLILDFDYLVINVWVYLKCEIFKGNEIGI